MEVKKKIHAIFQDAMDDVCSFLPTDSGFCQELVDGGALTGADKETLESIKSKKDRRKELVEILQEKPNQSYFTFMDILQKHQCELYERLKKLEEKHELEYHKAQDKPHIVNTLREDPEELYDKMASKGFDLDPMLVTTVVKMVESLVNEEGQITVRQRTIRYKAKGRFHSFKEPLVYDGTAWDIESGISEKAKHYKSKQGAIEHATLKLLERLKREGKME